jgi:hypothetical protein
VQAETFWKAQERLLNIYGSFMNHWLERRHRATQAAMEATQRMFASDGQAGDIPSICSEFMSGSLQRLSADIQECQECSSEIASMMQNAVPAWPATASGRTENQPAAQAE